MRVDNNIQNLLKRVGLNQYESAIYTSLLSNGVSTVGEIAESSRVPRSRVYDVLSGLEKKGFAIIQLGRPVKYSAIKSGMVLNKLKQQAENEYKSQLNHLDTISTDLEKELGKLASKQDRDDGEAISIIRGADNVNSHIKSMIESSRKKLLKVTDDNGLNRLHKHHRVQLTDAKKRGVKTRVITSNHKAKLPDGFKNFAETRHNKNLNGRFFVKDSNESFLLAAPETGIWIKGQYLANSLEQLFDHAWKKSVML